VHDVEELHDGGAVVGDGGGAAVVVHELVQSARALWVDGWRCGERGWGRSGGAKRCAKRRFGVFFQSGGCDLGRTRVVRTESTTAMHALMLEMSWPLPWLVSVPSRRSTIWGCC
jgi:hypothetical protein